jgi:predicted ATPase
VVDDRVASLPAQLRKGLLARATKALLRAAAAKQPLVVAMDDCHWLDAASAAIIAEAVGDLHDSPLGWLILHRPGWAPPASWPIDAHINLGALDSGTTAEMARALLGRAASDQTIAFVVDRAEGNPLYLVELCSAVSEAGLPAELRPAAETGEPPSHLTDQLRSLITRF